MATHTDIVKTTSHHVVTALAGEIDFPEHLTNGREVLKGITIYTKKEIYVKQPNNNNRNTLKDFK